MILDAIVIYASFALVIYELSKASLSLGMYTRVIRAIFRVLRIFLLIRKV